MRGKLLIGLAVVLLLGAGAWLWSQLEYVDVEHDLGPTRLAQRDPLLATRRLLERLGRTVEVSESTNVPPDADTVVFFALSGRPLPDARVSEWRDWIESGGLLVLLLPFDGSRRKLLDRADAAGRFVLPVAAEFGIELLPLEAEPEEAQRSDAEAEAAASDDADEFDESADAAAAERRRAAKLGPLEHLTVSIFGDGAHAVAVPLRGRRLTWYDEDPQAWVEAEAGAWMVSCRHGKGRIVVAADDAWLSNEGLGEAENAALVAAIASRRPHTWLMRSERRLTLLEWLLRNAGLQLAGLGCAIALWIWMRMQRFGPALAAPAGIERSFLEHLEACGAYLWRNQQRAALLEPLQRALRQRAERRRPDLLGSSGDAYIAELAEVTGLDAERLRDAHTGQKWSPTTFVRAVRTLLNARKNL
jgi:hypothetical protein